MGVAAASANVLTGILQIVAWRLKASHIQVSPWVVDRKILKQVSGYCSVLAFWSVSMLCISGLDLTIVGHYDFGETAYYSLATLPANLIIMIISAALGPLMPAASALSTQRSSEEMGAILCRTTRYATILVLLSGLPLVALGYPILRLWVGSTYALHSVRYLQILVLATIVRNLLLPYATIVVATGKQNIATAAGIAEAVVNLGSSIYLVRSIGAAGVAIGTLLGAFVGVLMHFCLSMHYTSATISVSRGRLFIRGLLRPSIIAIPTALLALDWVRVQTSYTLWLIWAALTLAAGWFGGLSSEERNLLLGRVGRKLCFGES
jgi:O-antigen/teichoic acid export membrane protein